MGITINELITRINDLSDEQEPNEIIIGFINDALGKINIECDADYPPISIEDMEEIFPIPRKWAVTLIVPFGVGRVKQRDSSEFEFSAAYEEFLINLDEFKTRYDIPEEYQDKDSQNAMSRPSDIYEKPPWFYGGF